MMRIRVDTIAEKWRVCILWLLIMVASFGLQLAELMPRLQYDRELIGQGRYGLLLTGHFVHLNWSHWGMNMAGLAMVAAFFSTCGSLGNWIFVLFFGTLVTGVGLYGLHPELIYYVGLSGVLHGLFVYGALCEWRHNPLSGFMLMILIVAKLLWELLYGALPGSELLSDAHVAVEAHRYGASGGVAAFVLIEQKRRNIPKAFHF